MNDVLAARLALQDERAPALAARVAWLLAPVSDARRALDVGCGTGALAFALAPLVASVTGVDSSADLLAAARELAPANCDFVLGEATQLPFAYGEFDIVGCLRLLHHVRRPELVVSELARVTRPGGRILVADELGHSDPLASTELDRFERARDVSHQRLLPDQDVRALLEANDLVVLSNEIVRARRELDVGWYVARKRPYGS